MSYEQNQENEKFFLDMLKFIEVLKQQTLCPEILEFKKDIFESLKEQIQDQNKRIKTFVQPDPQGNDIRAHLSKLNREDIIFAQTISQGQIKKKKYAFYLSTKHTGMINNLSPGEQAYLKSYSQLKYDYFYKSVLRGLHKQFHKMGGIESRYDLQNQGNSIQFESQQTKIDLKEPNMKQYCFIAITDNPERIRFNDRIKVGNLYSDKVIPTDQVIYTSYQNMRDFIKEGNGYLI